MASVQRRAGRRGTSWQVRWHDPTTGRRESATFGLERDARSFAADVNLAGQTWPAGWVHEADAPAQARAPTIADWTASWTAGLTGISERTRADYQRDLHRTLADHAGRRVDQLTADDVRDLVRQWERDVAPKTIANRVALLSGLLQAAADAGHRPDNPCRGVRLPRHRPAEILALTPQDVEMIAARMRRPEDATAVRVLAATGLRWGELAGLDVRHVDPLTARLTVAQSLARRGQDQHWTLGPPKTRRAHRTISLPVSTVHELLPLLAARPADAPIFTSRHGQRLAYPNWHARAWRPAVQAARAAGLESAPRIHDLRHAHASWLLAAGLPVLDVSRRLGHESVTTTADRYGHLVGDAQNRAAAALDALLSPPGAADSQMAGRPDEPAPR